MAFDFKKEYKEFYMPKNTPEIVNLPRANSITVRGQGDPNVEGGAYQTAIVVLYTVAYTLKMSYKTDHRIEGFYEYVVPPLEGFWWQEGVQGVDYSNKAGFRWISARRLSGRAAQLEAGKPSPSRTIFSRSISGKRICGSSRFPCPCKTIC